MTREEAEIAVVTELNGRRSESDRIVVLTDATEEHDFGWVVFYQSEKYISTGNLRDRLAGNAPYIVERESGRLVVAGTALPLEEYIAAYLKTGNPRTARR